MSTPAPREAIKILADVIQHELELQDGQVMLENQQYNIPQTQGVFVVLSYVSGAVIGNNSYPVPTPAGMTERLEVNMRYLVQIDIMSADASARLRKEEVIMALGSMYSQNLQTANGMSIGPVPPGGFINAGSLEQTLRLNRYTMTVAVTARTVKTKAVDYFSEFPTPEVVVNP